MLKREQKHIIIVKNYSFSCKGNIWNKTQILTTSVSRTTVSDSEVTKLLRFQEMDLGKKGAGETPTNTPNCILTLKHTINKYMFIYIINTDNILYYSKPLKYIWHNTVNDILTQKRISKIKFAFCFHTNRKYQATQSKQQVNLTHMHLTTFKYL